MSFFGIEVPNHIQCLPNSLFVEQIEFGERTTNWGFIIQQEEMDSDGRFVRPRWAKVLYKGDNINGIDVGDWIALRHGHWSLGINSNINGEQKQIWYVSPKSFKEGAIALSKTMPTHLKEYGYIE